MAERRPGDGVKSPGSPPKDPALFAVTAKCFDILKRDVVVMVTVGEDGRLSVEWRAKNEKRKFAENLVGKMFGEIFKDGELESRLPSFIGDA